MGVTPKSPKRVTNTLASVPAPFTSPVTVTTSYTGRERKMEIRKRRRDENVCHVVHVVMNITTEHLIISRVKS